MLGLAGWPAAAEEMVVARDLLLAELTGGPAATCATSPPPRGRAGQGGQGPRGAGHRRGRPPPLHPDRRSPALRPGVQGQPAAAREGRRRGGPPGAGRRHHRRHRHRPRPHAREDKEVEWATAPPGMLGLETALAVTLTELVGGGSGGLKPSPRSARGPGGSSLAPGRTGLPGPARRGRAAHRRAGPLPPAGRPRRPGGAGRAGQPGRLRPRRRLDRRPGPAGQPGPRAPFHGRQLRGRVVRTCSAAPSPSATGGPSGDRRGGRPWLTGSSARPPCWRWPRWPPCWSCRRSGAPWPARRPGCRPRGCPPAGARCSPTRPLPRHHLRPSSVRRFNGYGLLGRRLVGLALEEGGLRVDRDGNLVHPRRRPPRGRGHLHHAGKEVYADKVLVVDWQLGPAVLRSSSCSGRPPPAGRRDSGRTGAAVTGQQEALLVLEDGTAFQGEAFTVAPATVAGSGVQHRHGWLQGGPDRPIVP